MLNQFRSRYPQGSLLSELVEIDHGKYIVRALIEIEGVTLASGLAAATNIEDAEDRARIRALELLNLESVVAVKEETVKPLLVEEKSSRKGTKLESKEIKPIKDHERGKVNPEQAKLELEVSPYLIPEIPELFEEPAGNFPEAEPAIEESVLETIEEKPLSLSLEEVSPVVESTTPLVESQFSESPLPSEQLDFSEIIAQSNVELKRLGWTNEQGRDYLVQTYGKKSRQLLADEELLEFLHYLRTLPTP
jgi:hypothetical protein